MSRLLTFSLLLLFACGGGKSSVIDPGPPGTRKVVAPDRLYFKNIRSNRYLMTDDHELHRSIYIHDKVSTTPGWRWSITDDWLNDRAWLSSLETSTGEFYRVDEQGEEQTLFASNQLADLDKVRDFASRLAANYEICYRPLSEEIVDCLSGGSAFRLGLRETINDFLRLTAADRWN